MNGTSRYGQPSPENRKRRIEAGQVIRAPSIEVTPVEAVCGAPSHIDCGALMAPRTILYTGKGGVGKTSVAAATARRCAAAGLATVVLSTDPAHSLADALEAPLGPDADAVGDRLWAQQVSAQDEIERNWTAVQDWLGEMLVERGVDRISAEELTVRRAGRAVLACCRSSATTPRGASTS